MATQFHYFLPCRVTGRLGSGYFGQVKQGVWVNGDKEIDVAMKTLNKQVVRDEDQIKFLQEAAIMAQFVIILIMPCPYYLVRVIHERRTIDSKKPEPNW